MTKLHKMIHSSEFITRTHSIYLRLKSYNMNNFQMSFLYICMNAYIDEQVIALY